jgi:hypothetical protein
MLEHHADVPEPRLSQHRRVIRKCPDGVRQILWLALDQVLQHASNNAAVLGIARAERSDLLEVPLHRLRNLHPQRA